MYNHIFIKMKTIVGFLNIFLLANRQLAVVQLWENGEMYTVGHTERYTEQRPSWKT